MRIGIGALVLVAIAGAAAASRCPRHCGETGDGLVCGTDGKTYKSECALKQEKCLRGPPSLEVVHRGRCKSAVGKRTVLECKFGGVRLVVGGMARCQCNKAVPKIYRPVCGTNGITYDNERQLELHRCLIQKDFEKAHGGECLGQVGDGCAAKKCKFGATCKMIDGVARCECYQMAVNKWAPVCGTDGNTYDNEKQLEGQRCLAQRDIQIAHHGNCGERERESCATKKCYFGGSCKIVDGKAKCECQMIARKDYQPVCGADGNTYANEDLLKIESCKTQNYIGEAHYGECQPPGDSCETMKCKFGALCRMVKGKARCQCNLYVIAFDSPVCGTDGKSYGNWMELDVESCLAQKDIQIAHHGNCGERERESCATKKCYFGGSCKIVDGKAKCECQMIARKNYQPVCGADGNTYANEDLLKIARCKTQNYIGVAHYGECQPPGDSCETMKCKFGALCRMVKGKARCQCNTVVAKIRSPVCGTDGKSYVNWMELDVESCLAQKDIQIAHHGNCGERERESCATKKCYFGGSCKIVDGKAKCECQMIARKNYQPVCGADGNTYANEDLLKIARCKTQNYIGVAHYGECQPPGDSCETMKCKFGALCRMVKGKARCQCNTVVAKIRSPVCGTDGKSYVNWMALNVESCLAQRDIQIAHHGNCGEREGEGESGATKKSEFGGSCKMVDGKAECKCKSPVLIFSPVCGTDGKTYLNERALIIKSCETQRDIKKTHDGPCDQASQ